MLIGPGAGVPGRLPTEDPDRGLALAEHYAYPAQVRSTGRGWVRANMVTSLDGAVTGEDGRSGSVSSPADRQVFGVLRGLADVVLVGAGTARTEGYGPAKRHRLLGDRREADGRRGSAVVVQVTRSGRVETGRGMFDEPGAGLDVLPDGDPEAHQRAVRAAGEDAVLAAGHVDSGGVDLAEALRLLAARGLTRVLCEGGPALLGALAQADLLDELCLTTSPVVVSGDGARAVVGEGVPPRGYRIDGLLQQDSTLLARWVRAR